MFLSNMILLENKGPLLSCLCLVRNGLKSIYSITSTVRVPHRHLAIRSLQPGTAGQPHARPRYFLKQAPALPPLKTPLGFSHARSGKSQRENFSRGMPTWAANGGARVIGSPKRRVNYCILRRVTMPRPS